MFTDIVRSTQLVEAIGDEAWADLVRWHDQTLRALFAAHGGEEVHHTGDGFFVAFPAVRPALDCSVAIQRMLLEHRRRQGFAPQVRIGLHAAPAQRDGITYRGKGVHVAARIAALAEAGEILASGHRRVRAGGNHALRPA
jgi:class 3 adenylate cyclase